jgi:XTP/dITP diphosphohydrolase
MQICFASRNQNKVNELRNLLGEKFELKSLTDIGLTEEIQETGSTLEENALLKARYVAQRYKIPCFADDTGLEVEALNGAPGVYSARYAGEVCSSEANIDRLLAELDTKDNRRAQFRTIIALIIDENEHLFEGSVAGEITKKREGTGGFGYDPVFHPTGFDCTFAEMSLSEKNAISHRGQAVKKLVDFLTNP